MIHWLRANPLIWLLAPLVAFILSAYYLAWPYDLMRDTDFPYIDSTLTYTACVTDYPLPRARTTRYTVTLGEQGPTCYLYLAPDSTRPMPAIGDRLTVRTAIHRGDTLGTFDYGRWLRMQGIVGTGYVPARHWRVSGHSPTAWYQYPRVWQHRLARRLRRLLPEGEEVGIIQTLTLGYRDELDADQRHYFQATGAAHVLAVSGLHTMLLYDIVTWLLTLGGRTRPLYEERRRQWLLSGAILLTMWAYAAITGMTPSVVRSVIMLTVAELAICLHRPKRPLYHVLIAAWFILLISPRDLFSLSFQLSFAAVIAILLIVPLFPIPRHHAALCKKCFGLYPKVINLLYVSLAAQVGTLPLTMYYFGTTANYFLITNLIVLPLAKMLLSGSLLLLIVGDIPVLGTIASYFTYACAWLMRQAVTLIQHLPGATSSIHCTGPMAICLYAALLSIYLFLRTPAIPSTSATSPTSLTSHTSSTKPLWWLALTALSLALFCYLYAQN